MNPKKKSKDQPTLLEEQKKTRQKIGLRLRQLREETGLSQESFANENNLDRSQTSRIERGIANIEINTLVAYIRALDITIQEFFVGIE
jgi:transcriptional regulator with XRE-family HTH domain